MRVIFLVLLALASVAAVSAAKDPKQCEGALIFYFVWLARLCSLRYERSDTLRVVWMFGSVHQGH